MKDSRMSISSYTVWGLFFNSVANCLNVMFGDTIGGKILFQILMIAAIILFLIALSVEGTKFFKSLRLLNKS